MKRRLKLTWLDCRSSTSNALAQETFNLTRFLMQKCKRPVILRVCCSNKSRVVRTMREEVVCTDMSACARERDHVIITSFPTISLKEGRSWEKSKGFMQQHEVPRYQKVDAATRSYKQQRTDEQMEKRMHPIRKMHSLKAQHVDILRTTNAPHAVSWLDVFNHSSLINHNLCKACQWLA